MMDNETAERENADLTVYRFANLFFILTAPFSRNDVVLL